MHFISQFMVSNFFVSIGVEILNLGTIRQAGRLLSTGNHEIFGTHGLYNAINTIEIKEFQDCSSIGIVLLLIDIKR